MPEHELDAAGREGAGTAAALDLLPGRWQTVALGRALTCERPLLVQESWWPASTPHTEQQLFDHLARAAREYAATGGAVALSVSQRFWTIRIADVGRVIVDGRIVEDGSHAQLVGRGGLNVELDRLQTGVYR